MTSIIDKFNSIDTSLDGSITQDEVKNFNEKHSLANERISDWDFKSANRTKTPDKEVDIVEFYTGLHNRHTVNSNQNIKPGSSVKNYEGTTNFKPGDFNRADLDGDGQLSWEEAKKSGIDRGLFDYIRTKYGGNADYIPRDAADKYYRAQNKAPRINTTS